MISKLKRKIFIYRKFAINKTLTKFAEHKHTKSNTMNYSIIPMKPITHEAELVLLSMSLSRRDTAHDHANILGPEDLIKTVAESFGYTYDQLIEKNRLQPLPEIRYVLMWYFTEKVKLTQQATGDLFKRDHATCNHARRRVEERMYDRKMNEIYLTVMGVVETSGYDSTKNDAVRKKDGIILARMNNRFGMNPIKLNGTTFRQWCRFNGYEHSEVNALLIRAAANKLVHFLKDAENKNTFQFI